MQKKYIRKDIIVFTYSLCYIMHKKAYRFNSYYTQYSECLKITRIKIQIVRYKNNVEHDFMGVVLVLHIYLMLLNWN